MILVFFTFEKSSSFRRLSTPWQSATLYNIVHSGIGEQHFPGLCSLMFYSSCFLPFASSFFLLDSQQLVLRQLCSNVHKIISEFFFHVEFNLAKTGRQRSHSSRFQNQTRHLTQTNTNDEGLWFSFHMNYKLGPTHLRLTILYWQSNTFTSTANTMVLVIRALCKLVFPNLPKKYDQSTLISGTPFFSQWHFPSSQNL